jgi:hypothetical protein
LCSRQVIVPYINLVSDQVLPFLPNLVSDQVSKAQYYAILCAMFSSHSAVNDVDVILLAIPTIIAHTIARCAILYSFAFLLLRGALPCAVTAGMSLWYFLAKLTHQACGLVPIQASDLPHYSIR